MKKDLIQGSKEVTRVASSAEIGSMETATNQDYQVTLDLWQALSNFVPMHNGNPSVAECEQHTKRIQMLAETLSAYLGAFDLETLVEHLADCYKKQITPEDDYDPKLLHYNDYELNVWKK